MERSKKRNLVWKIIWIGGIYLILIAILYLVITYKVKWENKDLNKYLYFYNCTNELCTSDIEPEDYYNRLVCKDRICPYIIEKNGNDLILNDNNNIYIYNYIEDKVINNEYKNYSFMNNNYVLVSNELDKKGIIKLDGTIIQDLTFDDIIDYQNDYIIYKNNNYYGIKNINTGINIENQYNDVKYINNNYFAAKKDNIYHIYDYSNNIINNNEYDYVYSYKGFVLTINNNKIDILDANLRSVLLKRITTYYKYNNETEQGSLKIKGENDYIIFNVVNENNQAIIYKYNVKNNVLSNN